MMRDLLDDRRVEDFCAARPRWESRGRAIVGAAKAGSFMAAIGWVDRIADAAEELDHHPDIDIRWCRLTFVLTTHSAGGLTELDLLLAERIDAIVDGADLHMPAPECL
jgi:4a-hydroxytetrahydrobiopterin dehydratase